MKFRKFSLHLTPMPIALALGIATASVASASTPVQNMSDTVETLCPTLKKAFTANPNSLSSAEQDVLFRCGELKRAPGQGFLDLSGAQINGLDNMTSSESSTMGTSTVELAGVQNVAILGRLTVLRAKTSNSVASTSLPDSQQGLTLNSPETHTTVSGTIPGQQTENIEGSLFEAIDGYDGSFSQMSDFSKWGFFLTGSFGTGSKDLTPREPGFDFDSWSLVSGLDYRISDQFVIGGALSYGVIESTVDNNGGNVDLDGVGATVYGTYYVDAFYVDFLGGFSAKDYDTRRNVQYSVPAKAGGTTVVNQVFDSSTDAADVNLSVGSGYNLNYGGFGFTPFVQLAYLKSNIDGYTENQQGNNTNPGFGLALAVDDQDITSLTSTVGLQFDRTMNTSVAVFTPYIRFDWEHEYDNDSRNITARFATVSSSYDALNTIIIPTDEPDRDFFNLAAGISAVLQGGFQLFLDYSTVLDYENITLHKFTGGLRWEF